jgi:hypothetical protein
MQQLRTLPRSIGPAVLLLPCLLFGLLLSGCGDDASNTASTANDTAASAGEPASSAEDTAASAEDTAESAADTAEPVDPSSAEGDQTEATTDPDGLGTPSSAADYPSPDGAPPALPNVNIDQIQAFLTVDPAEDGPFYMVNLLRYNERANYGPNGDKGLTGQEADAIYGQFMQSTMLPQIGAEIVYRADVEADMLGGTNYDQVAVVRYPSRAAFASMQSNVDFQTLVGHKNAGVAETLVLATTLQDLPLTDPEPNPPFPATADDPPFAFVHFFDYRDIAQYQPGDVDAAADRPGRDAVGLYSQNAGQVAAPLGVSAWAWFDVEAVFIGESTGWDEVRINGFPSHRTLQELIGNPDWQAGSHHRTAGLEETYAIMSLPTTNRLVEE